MPILLTILVTLSFYAGELDAFPEMVRHGYANCISCHVNPNGGGLLTPYGRGLSAELMSTWGDEKEARFLHGLISLPDGVNIGGDVRAIQTYMNSPTRERADFIFMQADLEAGFTYKQWQAVASVGRQERTSRNLAGGTIFSRRHFISYRLSDQVSLRAGRFQTAFGINTADHMIATKRDLRWDEGSETYNLEAAWLGENYDVFLTGVIGRPDTSKLNLESGFALRGSAYVAEKHKIGVSYYYGQNSFGNRYLFGPYAILGLTPHFFILAELDFQRNAPNAAVVKWGLVNYLKVDYEFLKGLHGYVTQEFSRSDLSKANNSSETYGLGIQFFPRPHLEVNTMFLKTRTKSVSSDFSDFFWLLFHYYL